MRIFYFLCLVFVSLHFLQAQKNNDYIWEMGEGFLSPDTTKHTPDYLRTYGKYRLDFHENELRVIPNVNRLTGMVSTNTMYCNDAGKLMFYTNGQSLRDSNDMKIPNAERVGNYYPDYYQAIVGGYLAPQGALLLPWPGTDSIVLLQTLFNLEKYHMDVITATIIDHDQLAKKFVLKTLDTLWANEDIKGGKLVANRHANGRDWWLITQSYDASKMYVYLLQKHGFKLMHIFDGMIKNEGFDLGQSAFSQDGSKFGTIDMLYWDSMTVVSTFDFDRCTGVLSRYQHDTIENYEGNLGVGAIFSPSGRYFYAANAYNLYQYDLEAPHLLAGKKIVAEYDGFINSPSWPVEVIFGVFAHGPDGRLYNMTGQGTSRWAHRMDDPDESGPACNFRQHHVVIPNQSRSAPNFPNYRLGPIDGSPCDTLGLDNHPIAKYRYEPDSIQPLRIRFTDLSYFRPEVWNWDFGDGSPIENTTSTYHTFAQNGTYKVCLTVSNENSSHTFCRDITIGTSNVDGEDAVQAAKLTFFPNPFKDHLSITLNEYIPIHGQLAVYSLLGQQIHRQHLYYGHNHVDMSGLAAGMYLIRITDGDQVIQEEKVVKVE